MDVARFALQVTLGVLGLIALLVVWNVRSTSMEADAADDDNAVVLDAHLMTAIDALSDLKQTLPDEASLLRSNMRRVYREDGWRLRWWAESTTLSEHDDLPVVLASVMVDWRSGDGESVSLFPTQGSWSEQIAQHAEAELDERGLQVTPRPQTFDAMIDAHRVVREQRVATGLAGQAMIHTGLGFDALVKEGAASLPAETEDWEWHAWPVVAPGRGWQATMFVRAVERDPATGRVVNEHGRAEVRLRWHEEEEGFLIEPAATAFEARAAEVVWGQLRRARVDVRNWTQPSVQATAAALRDLLAELDRDGAVHDVKLRMRPRDTGWELRWLIDAPQHADDGSKQVLASLVVRADRSGDALIIRPGGGVRSSEIAADLAEHLNAAGFPADLGEPITNDETLDRMRRIAHANTSYRMVRQNLLRWIGHEPGRRLGGARDEWRMTVGRTAEGAVAIDREPDFRRRQEMERTDLILTWDGEQRSLLIEPTDDPWAQQAAQILLDRARLENLPAQIAADAITPSDE